MIVPYSQYLSFIVSAVRPYRMSSFRGELTFTFENYVKSQLHLQVVSELYERDIFMYKKALDYMRGNDAYFYECCEVLKYFYQDMSSMLRNVLLSEYANDVKIHIETNLGRNTVMPKVTIDLASIVEELKSDLAGEPIESFVLGVFSQFSMEDINKLEANELLALASIFLYYGSDKEQTYLVEVV